MSDARIVELSDGFMSADGGPLRLGKHGCLLELLDAGELDRGVLDGGGLLGNLVGLVDAH